MSLRLGVRREGNNQERRKPREPERGGNDDIFMKVFIEIAKQKLDGTMGGLLEAMIDKLSSGQGESPN